MRNEDQLSVRERLPLLKFQTNAGSLEKSTRSQHRGRMGVFVTGLSLEVLQPLTPDIQLVRAAVERTGELSRATYSTNNKNARAVRDELAEIIRTEDKNCHSSRRSLKKDRLTLQLKILLMN